MREARAASRVTAVPTVVLETGPLRLGKAGALRGGAWVSGLRGSCLTSPRGRQERLRTDAGSRTAPARMTKAQAESGGSGASSQPQACPDGVGERLRTDAGSRTAPARMTKAQAESGGSGASSQPQACPDGVGERLRTDAGSRTAPARMTKAQAESGGSGASSQPQACPDGVGERLRTDAGSRTAPARMTKAQAESGGSGASSQPQACPDGVGERLRTDAGSRTAPARMTKAQAESGGSGASSQPQACPDGVGERLRTAAGSRNAPARMTKPQAESGGSGASSQPQARPDGVGVSLPKSLAPVISTTGPPACPWAALSPEGPSRPEQKPAASGGLCACGGCVSVPLLPCDCVCLRLSHPLVSLWPSLSVCVFPSFCRFVGACPCARGRSNECARCAQRRLLARRPGSAEPLSSASVPGSCGGLVSGFRRRSTWGP
nr:uncharacterized protein LOC123569422 [Macaca fascicularis]